MNKVLVFTNYPRWAELQHNNFDTDDVEWNDKYKNIQNDKVLKCGVNKQNVAMLLPAHDLSIDNEGVYLVYDEIDDNSLKFILNQCSNDELFVLYHRGDELRNRITQFGVYCTMVRGYHDSASCYYDVFNILTDDRPNKTERIIHLVFLPKIKEDFLLGCMTPNNNEEVFVHACNILRNLPYLNNLMEEFLVLYQSNHGTPEFQNKWIEIRDALNTL